MKSLAGDSLVSLSGQFRYCSIARWNASVSSVPPGPVLLQIARFTVFTPISARELLCVNGTDDRRWCTPHDLRKSLVAAATNSGLPSEESSSGIPYVTKLRKVSMSPLDPPEAFSTMGQLEYLSTITR